LLVIGRPVISNGLTFLFSLSLALCGSFRLSLEQRQADNGPTQPAKIR
jgi:hypothetical protein